MKRNYFNYVIYSMIAFGLIACSNDNDEVFIPPTIDGIKENYEVERSKMLLIQPDVQGYDDAKFVWSIEGDAVRATKTILSQEKDLAFVQLDEGQYTLSLSITNSNKDVVISTRVTVLKEKQDYSAYISKVWYRRLGRRRN